LKSDQAALCVAGGEVLRLPPGRFALCARFRALTGRLILRSDMAQARPSPHFRSRQRRRE
jgi:hypothetical protein